MILVGLRNFGGGGGFDHPKPLFGTPLLMIDVIIFMLFLQSCTDSLHILPGSSSEKYVTPSDVACNSGNIELEEDAVVIEEGFTAINKDVDLGIKQEEIPEDITFSGIKSEPDEVSSMCVYVY